MSLPTTSTSFIREEAPLPFSIKNTKLEDCEVFSATTPLYLVEGSQGSCGSTSWMADGLLELRRSSKKLSMVGLGGDGGEWRVEVVGGEGCDEWFQARVQVDHEGGA